MSYNLLFIICSFIAAWILGRLLDMVFNRLFSDKSESPQLLNELNQYKPLEKDTSLARWQGNSKR